jgi:hypothetical protein
MAAKSAYEEDFLAWTQETACLLRMRRFPELDLENLIEEVETLGRSEWRELDNRLIVVLKHLLKWKYQPARRSTSWESTLVTQRRKLQRLLRRSPSLQAGVKDSVAEVWADAVREASVETRLPAETFPEQCPYTPEQILDPNFLP